MSRALIGTLVLAIFLSGCTHALEIKNRDDFIYSSGVLQQKERTLGIITPNSENNGKALVDSTAEALRQSQKVFYPFIQSYGIEPDLILTISAKSHHEGSGLNFFINWPGFLIFTPAWHGYEYKTAYTVQIEITNGARNKTLDSFTVPIDLDVRHADMNRTWTEVSYLEVSLIALISGIIFTEYDPKVTPLVEHEMSKELGSYLAGKILQHLAVIDAQPPST